MAQHLQGWLHALAHIGAAVNQGIPLGELLDLIAKTACNLLSYDFCAITMPDAEEQVLLIKGSYGLSSDYIRDLNATHQLRLHGVHVPSLSGQAFSMGVPVKAEDFGNNPAMVPWRAAARDQGYSSMISVPLVSANDTLGTLNCYTRSTHHFTEEEESRLLMLADQAAVAITTSRLRSEQEKRIKVLNELNEHQRRADRIHERLTALTRDGGGVGAIGGALAEILDRPVAVCEADGTILFNAERNGVSLPVDFLTRAGDHGSPDVTSKRVAGLLFDVQLPDPAGTLSVVRVPVMINDKVLAWIWTKGEASELRPLDRQVLERVTAPLALELLRSLSAAQSEWRNNGEILSRLLSGREHVDTDLVAQAERLGHDLTLPHAVIAVSDPDDKGGLPYWLSTKLERLACQVSPKPLFGTHRDYIVALWPLPPTRAIEDLRGIGDEIRRIPSEDGLSGVYTAITGPVTSFAGYPLAFASARGAIELATLRHAPAATLVLSDLGLAGLLLQLPDVSSLSRFADDVLGPLRKNHLAQDPSLQTTLSALIRNNLNAGRTAEQLRVEEDIVVKARRRSEDLLGVDLTLASDLTRISVALEIEEVLEERQRQNNIDA